MLVSVLLIVTACTKIGSEEKSMAGKAEGILGKTGSKLKDLVQGGAKLKCVYTLNVLEGTAKETVFIQGSTLRAELTSSDKPDTIVLVGKREGKKQCSYTWSLGVPLTEDVSGTEALKVCFDAPAGDSAVTDGSATGGGKIGAVDWDAEASCIPYGGVIDTNVPAGYSVNDLSVDIAAYQ